MKNYKKGDKVKLKSGSPDLIVEKVKDEEPSSVLGGAIYNNQKIIYATMMEFSPLTVAPKE